MNKKRVVHTNLSLEETRRSLVALGLLRPVKGIDEDIAPKDVDPVECPNNPLDALAELTQQGLDAALRARTSFFFENDPRKS